MDQPADREVPIADRQGYPQTTARAKRLVYATMTGTDIALYRLDKTYAQLKAEGAKVFRLASAPVRAGDPLTVASAGAALQLHRRGRSPAPARGWLPAEQLDPLHHQRRLRPLARRLRFGAAGPRRHHGRGNPQHPQRRRRAMHRQQPLRSGPERGSDLHEGP